MVEETEEEEEEEEEEGLEYVTDTPSGDSYTTPPSTGGCSEPSPPLSRSPTPGDSNPKNNMILRTKELEAHIEVLKHSWKRLRRTWRLMICLRLRTSLRIRFRLW